MVVANPIQKKLSLEDFLQLPETKPASEFINGEIRQKPMPQGKHSLIQVRLSNLINNLALDNKIAYALTEIRCIVSARVIVPDIGVFLWENLPKTDNGEIANKFIIPPDWIIEILSPEQSTNKVIEKILFCLNQGTKLGWLIDCDDQSVMVFQQNKLPEIKYKEEILTGLDILSEWNLTAEIMFNWFKI
ncbi:Uma2 family endonuclease [Geminocystis sp. GBBB08]|uniref:Uma2 family endonuclease n=1 Tax=Geminocystis sp. GBBB08 TaxID=2604140 RepID=UPI0027E31E00|nr:Uma2 family endonuclease [Geminocystis sp. GBBB08]MBL1210928.1 Uma2 family endonuclease [Geminocystis sp. GBBB08]